MNAAQQTAFQSGSGITPATMLTAIASMVLVLAFVSALGGGTLRDLLLDVAPIAWMRDLTLAYVALAAGCITFLLAKFVRLPFRALLYADAIGLAAFTVSGTQVALALGQPFLVSVMMGMASGIFGGIIRHIMANEIPLIFRHDVYATASLAGAVWVAVGPLWQLSTPLVLAIGFLITLTIRCAAIRWQLSLPGFLSTVSYRKENHPESK